MKPNLKSLTWVSIFLLECIVYAMNDGDTYEDEYDCDEYGLYEWEIL